jgi:putative membrane protein
MQAPPWIPIVPEQYPVSWTGAAIRRRTAAPAGTGRRQPRAPITARCRRERQDMLDFALRTIVAAIALWVAVAIVPGLQARDAQALAIAAILLGIVNATVRPVALLLSIPVTILTLGLFVLVVNAAMLGLVAWLVPGFAVAGFWSALLGAVVVSIVSAAVGGATAGR